MVIREPGVTDAERIALAHSIAATEAYAHYFPADWMAARNTVEQRVQQWTEQLSTYAGGDSGWRIRIAENGEQVLGFGIFGRPRDQDPPLPQELHRLYVLSAAYGTGLATRLLTALNPTQAASYLWVMVDNPRAIAFYRKQGYAPDGTVKRLENIGGHPILRMIQT